MALSDTIGIDIGGANTKVASASGEARSLYLPLWRDNDLADELRRIREEFQPKHVGVVITGELADAFNSKKEGICSIVSSVNSVFARPYYLNVRGQFSRQITEREAPLYAASNWTASAVFVARRVTNCIFVDMGSTTCDVIPIRDGKHAAMTTDFERLRNRELIYTGALRTNIATILQFVTLSGENYRLASELFAITADAHRVLGNISAEDYACDTPDARPRDLEACYRRIARVLLCDVDELGRKNARDVARQVERAQIDELAQTLAFQARKHDLNAVVGAGLGEFLIAKAASKVKLNCHLLSQEYGKELSKVFPAFAVANLTHDAFQRY
ncbi:MAG: hydantoinase/oxoprolinase family protein [Halobacteriota archaeon]